MEQEQGKLGILQKGEFQKYLRNLPTQRLAIVASTDEETGETRIVESHQVGNTPPETKVVSDKEIMEDN